MLLHATTLAFIGLLLLGLAAAANAQALRPGSPESVGLSAQRLERLSDALQAYVDRGELAGSVTLVARRILSRKTVELMTTSRLGNIAYNPGQGFGLGFYVVEDVAARGSPGLVDEFGRGGAYHTTYWVDPREALVVVHLTQLVPAGPVDDQAKGRALVYQAIVD